jgi:hypothetical protein
MAAFEAMCEGYLDISAHWHLLSSTYSGSPA